MLNATTKVLVREDDCSRTWQLAVLPTAFSKPYTSSKRPKNDRCRPRTRIYQRSMPLHRLRPVEDLIGGKTSLSRESRHTHVGGSIEPRPGQNLSRCL